MELIQLFEIFTAFRIDVHFLFLRVGQELRIFIDYSKPDVAPGYVAARGARTGDDVGGKLFGGDDRVGAGHVPLDENDLGATRDMFRHISGQQPGPAIVKPPGGETDDDFNLFAW